MKPELSDPLPKCRRRNNSIFHCLEERRGCRAGLRITVGCRMCSRSVILIFRQEMANDFGVQHIEFSGQWMRTTLSELQRAQDFMADLIYIWSGRGIYILLGVFPPVVHATLDQMLDIVAAWEQSREPFDSCIG